jgi:hypothetical protein
MGEPGSDTDPAELKKRESELKEKALRNKVVRSRKVTDGSNSGEGESA